MDKTLTIRCQQRNQRSGSACPGVMSPDLPKLRLPLRQPPTPETSDKVLEVMYDDSSEPRTPTGAAIPKAAYTVCPPAPKVNHVWEADAVAQYPWWCAAGKQ